MLRGSSENNTTLLAIVKRVKLIKKREFVEVALDKNANIFVIHVTVIEISESTMLMHCSRPPLLAAL